LVGNGPSKQPPCCGYETGHAQHERTEATLVVEEPLENEYMEVDELLKNWTRKLKKTKRNL
jgi:hypothetical protein